MKVLCGKFMKLYTVFSGYLCLRKLYMNRWLFNPASCTDVLCTHHILAVYSLHTVYTYHCITGTERGRCVSQG